MGILGNLLVLVKSRQARACQCLENQHGVMRRQGASRLGNDIRLFQFILLASIYQSGNGIVHVLLNRVVHAIATCSGTGPVIINTQSAPDVHEMYIVSHVF